MCSSLFVGGLGKKTLSVLDFFLSYVSVGSGLFHDGEQVGQSLGSIELSVENDLSSDIVSGDFVSVGCCSGGSGSGNEVGSEVG